MPWTYEQQKQKSELAKQRLAWLAGQAVAEDLDIALLQLKEAGEQGDQGGLAGAVGAEQGGEAPGCQREGQVVQRLACTIGEADAAHLERVHGVTTTPQG